MAGVVSTHTFNRRIIHWVQCFCCGRALLAVCVGVLCHTLASAACCRALPLYALIEIHPLPLKAMMASRKAIEKKMSNGGALIRVEHEHVADSS